MFTAARFQPRDSGGNPDLSAPIVPSGSEAEGMWDFLTAKDLLLLVGQE